ncbi:MAG: hypothetical protein ACRDXX_12435, partial [Stackebrandtia sp.]
MHPPIAAYLRVYEPLSAFSDDRAAYWLEYTRSGRAAPVESGPRAQRALLYEAVGSGWNQLPSEADEAYVVEGDGGPLICPW